MDRMTTQLKSADIIVIAFPMYNFSMPAIIKTWFDFVIQKGVTFGNETDGPIDKNECNIMENNQNDFSNILPQNNQTIEDFSLYENSTFGVKINYPKNWTMATYQNEYPLTDIVTFFSPETKDYVQVSLYTYDYSNTIIDTIKELLNDAINSYESYPEDYPDFQVLASNANKVLGELPAYMLEGQYQDSEFGKQMILETGTIKDDINYFIEIIASPSQYLNYSDEVATMIDSFKIQIK